MEAETTQPIFCKSPTVAALFGLDLPKSINPAVGADAMLGGITGVAVFLSITSPRSLT